MTIKDVAKAAGVSVSAVSRYLNGGSLSAEKAARIAQAVEETGYRPNQAAQTLRSGSVRQVGIIVPKIHSQSVSQVLAGVVSVLEARGYMTTLGSTNARDEKELAYLEMMQTNQVAGIILMATTLTPAKLEAYRSCKVPLVLTGQSFPGIPCVYHDDYNAMKELTARMITGGRKRLCYIGVTEKDQAAGIQRRIGVQDAMKEAGLDGENLPRLVGDFTLDSGYSCMTELLAMEPRVDGVICATDRIAQGAMRALREKGRRVPQDVWVAGVGDNWADIISQPQLTTVRLYHQQCGAEAAGMLLQMLEAAGEELPLRQTKLGYTILERESTGRL